MRLLWPENLPDAQPQGRTRPGANLLHQVKDNLYGTFTQSPHQTFDKRLQ